MTSKLFIQTSSIFIGSVLVFALTFTSAFAHGDEVHETTADSEQIAKMQQIVTILTQIVELYKKKAEVSGVTITAEDHHGDSEESEGLKVWVELHSNQTHAHVSEAGKKEQSWLLADLEYTEEEAIIEAIAEKSGLSEHEIEEVIVFPSGEVDEKGDSVEEHDENADQDVSGIHIMSDGEIMWGNGTEVHDATITADGKVKLSDGSIITPKFDLR